jgi:hypothetical protein
MTKGLFNVESEMFDFNFSIFSIFFSLAKLDPTTQQLVTSWGRATR